MISKSEQITIKKVFGGRYTPKIIERLNSRKIFNQRGTPYSPRSIQQIMAGERENRIVEMEIIEMTHEEIGKQRKIDQKKKQLLK